ATSTATAGAGGNLDLTVLQFALTLEHLEDVFYQGALQNFTLQDFNNAGYSQDYYHNLKYIAYDEQTHVQVLETLIKAAGGTPNAPCTYDFPYTNVKSFITLSGILENVGTSAYLGAAPLITGADYLTDAGAILAVEALHTSYQRAAIGEVPNANPFQTPLDPTSAYTLASMFIVSCPKGNTKLPGGWPNPGNNNAAAPVQQGATITLTSAAKIPAGSYVTFISGLTVTSVKGNVNGKSISVKIPTGLSGQSYAFVTNQDVEGTFNDKAVIAGPAVVEV
ncbi:ferritin-like domain-containing protein, partial [Neohortaea acidophila]